MATKVEPLSPPRRSRGYVEAWAAGDSIDVSAAAAAIEREAERIRPLHFVNILVNAARMALAILAILWLQGAEYESLCTATAWGVTTAVYMLTLLPRSHWLCWTYSGRMFELFMEEPAAVEHGRKTHVKTQKFFWLINAFFVAEGALTAVLLFDDSRVTGPLWLKVASVAITPVIMLHHTLLYTRPLHVVPKILHPLAHPHVTTSALKDVLDDLLRRIADGAAFESVIATYLRVEKLVELSLATVVLEATLAVCYPLSTIPLWIGIVARPDGPSALMVFQFCRGGVFSYFVSLTAHLCTLRLESVPAAFALRAMREEHAGNLAAAKKFHRASVQASQLDLGWTLNNTKITGYALLVMRATILPAAAALVYQAGGRNALWWLNAEDVGLA